MTLVQIFQFHDRHPYSRLVNAAEINNEQNTEKHQFMVTLGLDKKALL